MRHPNSKSTLLRTPSLYTPALLTEFYDVLGDLPNSYKEFLLKFKTGYPSFIQLGEDDDEYEVMTYSERKDQSYILEAFYTLPQVLSNTLRYDNNYGLSAAHRKQGILPFCSSGSSYQEYFIRRTDSAIFALDPNEYLDREYEGSTFEEEHLIHPDLSSFINGLYAETWE